MSEIHTCINAEDGMIYLSEMIKGNISLCVIQNETGANSVSLTPEQETQLRDWLNQRAERDKDND